MQTPSPLKIPRRLRHYGYLKWWLQYRKMHKVQRAAESALNKDGIDFRKQDREAVQTSYSQMTQQQFDGINSRQQWVNRVLVPKCLHRRLPNRAVKAIDLGCGTGESTMLLAKFLPPGSRILGFDLTRSLLEVAKKRRYRNVYNQHEVPTDFVNQDITQPLKGPAGDLLKEDSCDYFNTSGIVGHHLKRSDFTRLVRNLSPLVRSGGLAAIDEGPCLGEDQIRPTMQAAGWHFVAPIRVYPWWKRGQLLFRKP